jgi:hypothetical protein
MAVVHITNAELDVLPSAVAALAIVGAYLGVRSANRSQVRLTRGTYDRDRLTETYIDLFKGVHNRNAQLDDTYMRPINQTARTPTRAEFDFTSDHEALFGARLLAYACQCRSRCCMCFRSSGGALGNCHVRLGAVDGVGDRSPVLSMA